MGHSLFSLELERVVGGTAGVLILTLHGPAILRIRQKCLGNGGGTSSHLLSPPWIGLRDTIHCVQEGLSFGIPEGFIEV